MDGKYFFDKGLYDLLLNRYPETGVAEQIEDVLTTCNTYLEKHGKEERVFVICGFNKKSEKWDSKSSVEVCPSFDDTREGCDEIFGMPVPITDDYDDFQSKVMAFIYSWVGSIIVQGGICDEVREIGNAIIGGTHNDLDEMELRLVSRQALTDEQFNKIIQNCPWICQNDKDGLAEMYEEDDGLPVDDIMKMLYNANYKLSQIGSGERIYLTLNDDYIQVRSGKKGIEPEDAIEELEVDMWGVEGAIKQVLGDIVLIM